MSEVSGMREGMRITAMEMTKARAKRESGAALLVAMMMMVILAMVGASSLNTVQHNREVAGTQKQAGAAVFLADAGLADGFMAVHAAYDDGASYMDVSAAPVPSRTIAGVGSYGADPSVTDSTERIGTGGHCDEVGGDVPFQYGVWTVRARGVTTGGAIADVEANVLVCELHASHSNDSKW